MRLVTPGLLLLAACAAPERNDPAWSDTVAAQLDRAAHQVHLSPAGPAAEIPAQGVHVRFDAAGAHVRTASSGLSLSLTAAGRNELEPLPPATPQLGARLAGQTLPDGSAAQRLEYPRGELVEWFAGSAEGLHHGWSLDARPQGAGPLQFQLSLDGALLHLEADSVDLLDEEGAVWRYDGLAAWDATGRALPSRFEAHEAGLRVVVDDRSAVYPIEVDPVLSTAATTLSGPAATSGFGFSLSSAGDVNADGYDDVIVGAYKVSGNTGAAYVYHGSASGLASTASTTLNGPTGMYYCGYAVAGGGDVNDDGYDDVAMACVYSLGRVYIHHGSASGVGTTATSTLSSTSAIRFGYGLAVVPSLDGDAYADVAVGAPNYSGAKGRTTVYAGGASGVATTASVTLDGSAGSSYFGLAITSAGDVNGDGYGDLAIAAPSYAGSSGQASVYYGSATGISSSSVSTVTGSGAKALGTAMAAGDFDADGYDDLAVGSSVASGGDVWIFEGGSAGLSSSASLTLSDSTTSYFGAALAAVRDSNDDGYADLAVGAYGSASAALYEGGASGLGSTAEVTVTGSGSAFGLSVASADVNGDGFSDLVVGDHLDTSTRGEARVYLGYIDEDGDGYVVGGDGTAQDCDDGDSAVNPGATEIIGNDLDDDCDGDLICYVDADEDGFLDPSLPTAVSADADCDDAGEDDGTSPATDCDDSEASAHAGGTEVPGDGIDQDCDGSESCWVDADDDGQRPLGATLAASDDGDCDDAGEATGTDPATDCDDADATIFAGAPEVVADGIDQDCDGDDSCYVDLDLDGYGSSDTTATAAGCAASGVAAVAGDCDDGAASTNPAATETCDDGDTDENCDGSADGADAVGTSTWYADLDGDGFGDSSTSVIACEPPTGFVANDDDCDDGDAGLTDTAHWYTDGDGDGFGDSGTLREACLAATGEVGTDGDCDDSDGTIFPSADETTGDGVDQDCDGVDECFVDDDGDGARGTATTTGTTLACSGAGEADATAAADCNDGDAGIHPGATETAADGVDSDCDGAELCHADADLDGVSSAAHVSSTDLSCTSTGTASTDGGDCDDSDASVHPGATEAAGDSVDQDCDGMESCFIDLDDDGYRSDSPDEVASADTDCDDAGEAAAGDPLGDCDDADPAYHPAATESDCTDPSDYNCDGSTGYDDADGDGWAACLECDDGDIAVNPDATEATGDGIDQDCDGLETCYVDLDDDGYRPDDGSTVSSPDLSCLGAGEAEAGDPTGDCNDGDGDVSPAAAERTGDGIDSNCDGAEVCFADGDGDGFRTEDTVPSADADCDDAGESAAAEPDGDCDDNAADWHPGAEESCDLPEDRNCDGAVGSGDGDGDGVSACDDCNDADRIVHPGATESCNGVDDDCSGAIDDGAVDATSWYTDGDADGYGSPDAPVTACVPEPGQVSDNTDCDDANAAVHPGAEDIPDDGADQDCDGEDAAEVITDKDVEDRDGGFFGGCNAAGGTPAALLLGMLALRRRRQPR
jgi:hypothetical protein